MSGNQDVYNSLICAVREGSLERARELINSLGLPYSQAWSDGYVLLCDAIKNKHAAIAKLLLTSGSEVNSRNIGTDTPLHFAVINGDIEIVQMILDKGANIDAKNRFGETPLYIAIDMKKRKLTKLLLSHGADANARDNDGTSLLHVAVEEECLQIIKHLLKHGADVNYVCIPRLVQRGIHQHDPRWDIDQTPLHLAVAKGSKEVIALLLSRGINVDVKGEDSMTPLHLAAMMEHTHTHIAEYLLNHGACIHSLTLKEGYTPLHCASEWSDSEEIVKLFLNRGADINARTKGNETPLHIATKSGNEKVVKLLLQHGAKVDNQDKDGKTILNLAVETGNLMIVEDVLKYCPDIYNQSNISSLKIAVHGSSKEIVEALLEYGFMVNPVDANNTKLLHTAAEKGHLKIVEDLLKYGANVNMIDNSRFIGSTPLHSAARRFQDGVAKLLISNEADINAKDKYGKTPIFYAIKNNDLKMFKLLLTSKASVKDSPELLNIAAENRCIEIVEALLQHGADVNASDEYGRTALHFTATREIAISEIGEVSDITKENFFAQFDSETIRDMTRRHLGARKGYKEIVETILKFGADIDSRDGCGRTALHIASENGHEAVVITLLQHGADINITSVDNHTPLDHVMVEISKRYKPDDFNDLCYFSCQSIAGALKRHLFKMKIANLYVSERNLLSMSLRHEITDLLQLECEKEIASMKNEKFNNHNISFYDILAKCTSSLAILLRNENIVQVLKSDNYKTKFPIYASMIQNNFRKGMERKQLLEQ